MPTRSLFPDIVIPEIDIWSLMFESEYRDFPEDKVVLSDTDSDRSYTFAQVRDTAAAFGQGLRVAWEWRPGDVLAIFSPNSIDMPPAIWGCHWAGGVVTTANPAYTVEELAFQLKDSSACAIATQKPLLSIATKAAKTVGIPEDRIVLLGNERDGSAKFKHFTSIRNYEGIVHFRRRRRKPDDLSFLPYSSGTTGLPKGVMLTHRNIVSNILQMILGEGAQMSWRGGPGGKGDQVLGFLPFFHIYGLTCCVHYCIFVGLNLHVMPRFDLERFCKIVQDRHVTFAFAVPPVILALSKQPIVSKFDLSSLRMINSGAAPLTRELVNAMHARIHIPVKQGYGLSETSPVTHSLPWGMWREGVGSVGRLLPNMIAKYVSEDGRELPSGEVGELWLKGPNVFKGYLNNPEGTANALTADGYFRTGDVGYQDDRGCFFITDRAKELIKYKGFQVPPAELEGLLMAHPDVDDVAVIGVRDEERATEVPRAFVVAAEGVPRNEESGSRIIEWLAERVAQHKRLRGGVEFVDMVPKSASGKILRRLLRDRIKNQNTGESGKAKL